MANTDLTAFYGRLRGPLGRSDTTGDSFIARGINFGCLLVALLFDPAELQTTGSLTIAGSGTLVSLSTLTRLRLIKYIYNETSNGQIFYIPPERFRFFAPTGAGNVRFYSIDGGTLYTRPTPAAANTLTAYYNQFPLVVSGASDVISLTNHDSLIEFYALAYAQGCLDETENATFWQKLGDTLLIPEQVMTQARKYLEGGPSGYNPAGTKA